MSAPERPDGPGGRRAVPGPASRPTPSEGRTAGSTRARLARAVGDGHTVDVGEHVERVLGEVVRARRVTGWGKGRPGSPPGWDAADVLTDLSADLARAATRKANQ